MKKYDIILVKFPFSDLSQTKRRPALILAKPKGDTILLCQISTKERRIKDFEVKLAKKATTGNIKFDSNVYVDMLFTLHKNLINQKIGSIKEERVRKEIEKKINKLFS